MVIESCKEADLIILYENENGNTIERRYGGIADFIGEMESDAVDIPMLDYRVEKAFFFGEEEECFRGRDIEAILKYCKETHYPPVHGKVKDAINSLQFDIDMLLYDPNTGETMTEAQAMALNNRLNCESLVADKMGIRALETVSRIPMLLERLEALEDRRPDGVFKAVYSYEVFNLIQEMLDVDFWKESLAENEEEKKEEQEEEQDSERENLLL